MAAAIDMDEDALIDRIRATAAELPHHLGDEIRKLAIAAQSYPVVARLGSVLPERAAAIARA